MSSYELESVAFTNSFPLFQSKALSADRKAHFEEEIKTLSGALKAQYDQANKEYEGLKSLGNFNSLKLLYFVFVHFRILIKSNTILFSDLPASTPLVDLSKMADLDMGKLPKVEESGDRCIRRIQAFIINELSSDQAAVLPEDKLQRLLVGVSFVSFHAT